MTLLLCAVVGVWAQVTLAEADFTSAEWQGATFSQGNTNTQDVINGITFHSKSTSNQFSVTADGLVFPNSNMSSSNYFFGVPLTDINGAITVTLKHIYSSAKASFKYVFIADATEFSASIGNSGTQVKDANNADTEITFTVETTATKGYLYIGRQGSNYTTMTGFTVTTPGAAVAVDPVFSLDKASIGLDETAQIIVGSKSGLDGLTMSDLTYDNTVISIDETGKITPVAQGTSAITFTTAAIDGKYNAGTANLSITVTAPVVATPVITPADGSKFYTESQVVTATCETEDAVLSYSTDNEATWTALPEEGVTITETTTIIVKAEKDGYVASKATATITKVVVVLDDPEELTADAATWDWSKYGVKEIATSGYPFYREEILVSNVAKYGFTAPAADFGPASTLSLKGDFIVRDSKYCQVTEAKFKTANPGKLGVVFSNTGKNRPYRYLSVNGTLTEFKSNVSDANTEAADIAVPAGDVVINGVVDPDAEENYTGYTGGDAGQVNFIRIFKITFTKSDTTGIQNVEAKNPVSGETYNLNGQRVAAPVKGLYIVNGRKVVVK